MKELEIPERAYEAAVRSRESSRRRPYSGSLEAAAPIIVAAELRRLRDELKRKAEIVADVQAAGILYAAWSLQERAKRLDPEGNAT